MIWLQIFAIWLLAGTLLGLWLGPWLKDGRDPFPPSDS